MGTAIGPILGPLFAALITSRDPLAFRVGVLVVILGVAGGLSMVRRRWGGPGGSDDPVGDNGDLSSHGDLLIHDSITVKSKTDGRVLGVLDILHSQAAKAVCARFRPAESANGQIVDLVLRRGANGVRVDSRGVRVDSHGKQGTREVYTPALRCPRPSKFTVVFTLTDGAGQGQTTSTPPLRIPKRG